MSAYQAYWDVPAEQAPMKTGAANLKTKRVLDVGCGTGRLAAICGPGYVGLDVSPGMVAYARENGVDARHVSQELTHDDGPFDIVTCLSVFTHIRRRDRDIYLRWFASLAPTLLADILPAAKDDFSIQAAFSEASEFEHDLTEQGFTSYNTYSRIAHTGYGHRYYHAWL